VVQGLNTILDTPFHKMIWDAMTGEAVIRAGTTAGLHSVFFRDNKIPFWDMYNADSLIGNPQNSNSRYYFARPGDVYVVYLPGGGTTELEMGNGNSVFKVEWFNPREGGSLQPGSVKEISGPGKVTIGQPPSSPNEDWIALIRK